MTKNNLKYWFYAYLRTEKSGTTWAHAFISHHKSYFPLYEVSVGHTKSRNPRGVVITNFIEITKEAFDDYMKQFNEKKEETHLYDANSEQGQVIPLFPKK